MFVLLKRLIESENYILKDFPEGYRFYHHNKGPVDDPRTDPYLYGKLQSFFHFSFSK